MRRSKLTCILHSHAHISRPKTTNGPVQPTHECNPILSAGSRFMAVIKRMSWAQAATDNAHRQTYHHRMIFCRTDGSALETGQRRVQHSFTLPVSLPTSVVQFLCTNGKIFYNISYMCRPTTRPASMLYFPHMQNAEWTASMPLELSRQGLGITTVQWHRTRLSA